MIKVNDLNMTYRVAQKEEGLRGSLKALFSRQYNEVHALSDLSFEIPTGGIIGLIGPNGAGKTTLLKILSGVINPTSGEVDVIGYRPFDHNREFKRKISLIMGQRSQLLWDVAATESFKVIQAIYEIEPQTYKRKLDELLTLLNVEHRRATPVRQLSLGERTKMNIIAGLLYSPQVLFLDEPTIGLDIKSQLSIRKFLRQYAAKQDITILLTSHYMADIEETCSNILMINQGQKLFHGDIGKLKAMQSDYKYISFTASDETVAHVRRFACDVNAEGEKTVLKVRASDMAQAFEALLAQKDVGDISIVDTPIETIILEMMEHG